jgi:Dioxygenases related to 2-nitropropane dioxygenase
LLADGRAIAAALALGAEAVCVGTRLLASREAFAHPEYKRRIVAAGENDTLHAHFAHGNRNVLSATTSGN